MWRVEVTEIGRTPLPPIDIEADELVIGSGEGCQLRLPARAVHPQHLRLRRLGERPLRMTWRAGHGLEIDGSSREAGELGEATEALLAVIGEYRLHISEAGGGASLPTSPQRTESLVREMIRNIMGGAAPRLVVEAGPAIGSSRTLAPPDSRLTVGRGDEADWVILDEDLSRVHAALVRTWDGVRVMDLGSKNGTLVDGVAVPSGEQGPSAGLELRNGARLTFGDVVVRYFDDAETYLLEMGEGAEEADADAAARPAPRDAERDASAAASREGAAPRSKSPSRPPSQPASGRPGRPPTAPPAAASSSSRRSAPHLAQLAEVATTTAEAGALSAPPAAAPGGSLFLICIGLGVAALAIAAALWLLGAG